MDKTASTEHPIHPLLNKRWSSRAFSTKSVEKSTLLSLLEAARWAPSSYNEQPWHFLLAMRDEDPDSFRRIADCLVPFNRSWAIRAPVLMLIFARSHFQKKDTPNAHAWHDVGLAAMSLTVEAIHHGLGVHMLAGIDKEKIYKSFRVPEDHAPVIGLVIGYHDSIEILDEGLIEKERQPRTRKPLSEIVSWGKFP
jgi:nitroreductase